MLWGQLSGCELKEQECLFAAVASIWANRTRRKQRFLHDNTLPVHFECLRLVTEGPPNFPGEWKSWKLLTITQNSYFVIV
jgi:hypothetical protein